MPDYEKMYGLLFNRISDVIEVLKEAQRETEKPYLQEENEPDGGAGRAPE